MSSCSFMCFWELCTGSTIHHKAPALLTSPPLGAWHLLCVCSPLALLCETPAFLPAFGIHEPCSSIVRTLTLHFYRSEPGLPAESQAESNPLFCGYGEAWTTASLAELVGRRWVVTHRIVSPYARVEHRLQRLCKRFFLERDISVPHSWWWLAALPNV